MSPDTSKPQRGNREAKPQAPEQRPPATAEPGPQSVEQVIADELEQVARRRDAHNLGGARGGRGKCTSVYEEAGRRDLVGLALSGGGIRSATFCLGVLQGLAGLTRLGPLKYLDYLSTVSGGGYIGSWFVAWVSRAGGRLSEVERLLKPRRIDQPAGGSLSAPQGADREPDPIFHLRRYSNYLSPRLGFLSADVWVLWATYLRNFLVCQLVLLPAAVGVLVLARVFLLLYHSQSPAYWAQAFAGGPELTGPALARRLECWEWRVGGAIAALWSVAAFCAFMVSGAVRPDAQGNAGGKNRRPSGKLVWEALVPLLYVAAWSCWGPAQLRPYGLWISGATLALWLVAAGCTFPWPRRERPDVPPAPPAPPAGGKRLRSLSPFWLVVLPLGLAAVLLCLVPAFRLYKLEHPSPVFSKAAVGAAAGAVAQQALFDRLEHPGPEYKDPQLVVGLPWFPASPQADDGSAPGGAGPREPWPVKLEQYLAADGVLSREFVAFALVPAGLVAVAYLLALLIHRRGRDALAHLSGVLAAGVAGGVLLFYTCRFLVWLSRPGPGELSDFVTAQAAARVTTFGPPLVLGVIVLTVYLGIALLRNRLSEGLREWWSRLCARLMIVASLWAFVTFIAIYATAAVIWAGPWAKAALGSGWLLTVAGGVLAGGAPRTDALKARRGPLDWLALLAPPLFVVGLLVGLSLLLHTLLDSPPNWEHGLDTAEWMRHDEPPHPAVRVSDTTHSFWGLPVKEHRKVTEHAWVFDDLAVASRVYWLGMFNTDPNWVPRPKYQLTQEDVRYLREKRNLPEAVANRLDAIRRCVPAVDSPDEFSRQYASALANTSGEVGTRYAGAKAKLRAADKAQPGEVTQEELLKSATDAYLIQPSPGKVAVKLGIALGVCAVLLGLAAWRVDVNLFSLHALYGNRLTRCYLGASHDGRDPDSFINFDPDDDLPLAQLEIPADRKDRKYDGPYLLVNAALNLVRGSELAWQERKAEPFLFSPLRCGSPETGFRDTAEYAGGVPLGTAMTVSGAAVSPNSGYSSSAAMTVLLTVFNARLGAWLGNPKSPYYWQNPGPRVGFWHLFKELFGWTDDKSGYVYLSDGGHFENLGGYELVRRRCRYIIVVDADCDGRHLFENLGNLIRKCRTDFGIPIEIDLDALRRSGEGRVRWHCAVGKVRYDAVDFGTLPGILVYLKPSLTGDEPADVLHYAAQHPAFPHETTADQFFSESQFESYRALGQHVAETVFGDAVEDVRHELEGLKAPSDGERRRTAVRALFASVARRWFALPPDYEASFLNTTRSYTDLHRAMADDARLRRLTLGMYPELAAVLDGPGPGHPLRQALEAAAAASTVLWPRTGEANGPASDGAPAVTAAGRECAEVHTLVQMLQIMENAWLSLNLDVHYAHPLNRGWMDVFYRWANTPLFRRHWPLLRSEFARGFVSFCEKQVHMGHVEVECKALPPGGALPDILTREFSDEWTDGGPGGPQARLKGAGARCWLIYARMADHGGRLPPPPKETPFGFILVRPDPAPPDYEFLVWVRGAYRNSGVGREAALWALQKLTTEGWPAQPFRLIVRLPVGNLTGPGGRLLRSMWETFFHHLDFRPVYQPAAPAAPGAAVAGKEEVVLERHIPPQ
jgi:hypothetical protein